MSYRLKDHSSFSHHKSDHSVEKTSSQTVPSETADFSESDSNNRNSNKKSSGNSKQKSRYSHNIWQQLVIVGKRYSKDDVALRANALTYQSLLALVPMITLFLVLLSYIPQLDSAKSQIKQAIYNSLLPSSSQQIMQYLDEFAANSSDITLIGLVVLIYTGVSLLDSTEKIFNNLWGVRHPKQSLLGSLKYWLLVSIGPIFIGVAFVLYSAISSLYFLNDNFAGYSVDWAVWLGVGAFAFMILGLGLIYWLVPSCQVPFREAMFAAVVVGILLEILRASFGGLISSFSSYSKVYGTFAAIPIFFLWINLTWNIVLLGVELTIVRTYDYITHKSYSSIIDALVYLIYQLEKKSLKGKSLNQYEVRHALGQPQLLSWSRYTTLLLENGIIREYNKNRYHLNVAMEDVYLSDLLSWLDYPDMDEQAGKLRKNTTNEEREEQTSTLPHNPSLKQMSRTLKMRPFPE